MKVVGVNANGLAPVDDFAAARMSLLSAEFD